MIITTNGRRSIRVILGLLIAGLAVGNVIVDATAPSSLLRGVAPLDGIAIEDQREIFERRLQICSSYSKRNCSNAGCVWVGGVCQPASTPPPSPPPVSSNHRDDSAVIIFCFTIVVIYFTKYFRDSHTNVLDTDDTPNDSAPNKSANSTTYTQSDYGNTNSRADKSADGCAYFCSGEPCHRFSF
jgi:hypothetical protein